MRSLKERTAWWSEMELRWWGQHWGAVATVPSSPRWDRLDAGKQLRAPSDSALCVKVLVSQSCPTICNPMDCSLPGSSVPGILKAGILEWIAIPFPRGSSRPRVQTWVSCIIGRFFTICATREAHCGELYNYFMKSQFNNIEIKFLLVIHSCLNFCNPKDFSLFCPWIL